MSHVRKRVINLVKNAQKQYAAITHKAIYAVKLLAGSNIARRARELLKIADGIM